MKDDILLRRIEDVCKLCDKYRTPRFSHFLDEREQAEVASEFPDGMLFGGYADAERKIFGKFPDWEDPNGEEFPIKLLIFTRKYERELTHRHFLGTLMSLGLEREKIGDIVIDEDKAFVFAESDVAEYIKDNVSKIAGVGVKTEISDCIDGIVPKRRFEEKDTVCASMRLDAVIAAILKISRNEAKTYIASGKARINHVTASDCDTVVGEGDLLSLRGYGRTEISEIGGKTRSDRLHITFKKYL